MPLRVLVCEYVTSGGFTESSTPPPILSEAYAMVSSLLKDFSYNAGCEAVVILDKKLAEMVEPLAAKRIIKVSSSGELDRAFRSTLSQVDAAIVVAPETNDLLSRITEVAEDEGDPVLLGSSSRSVKFVSNKEKALEVAGSVGVAVPRSIATSADESEATVHNLARDIGYPVVIKPNDGAGCDGILVVNDRQDLSRALKIAGGERSKRRLLLQEYVRGADASVSILSSKTGHATPLSLNKQMVELKSPKDECSTYKGGYTPFNHPLKWEAFDCARRIVEAVNGLKGYVGIDFVLTEEKPIFLEVNARITTSYVGLYRVLLTDGREGVASAIIDAATSDNLPSRIVFKGLAYYSKFKLKADLKVDQDMIDVLSNLEYVESPPFPYPEGGREGFLVSVGESLDEASFLKSCNEKKFERIALKLEKQ